MERFRIHFTYPDGTEDSFIEEAGTIEEIQEHAKDFFTCRGSTPEEMHAWSVDLNEKF